MALLTANEVMTQVAWLELRAQVAGNGRQRDVGDGGVEHLHEGRQRQADGAEQQAGGGKTRYCSCANLKSGRRCADERRADLRSEPDASGVPR